MSEHFPSESYQRSWVLGQGTNPPVWRGERRSLPAQPWEVLDSRGLEGGMDDFFPKHGDYKPHKSLLLLTWGQSTLRDGSWSQQKHWWCELLPPNPSFLLLSSTSWSQNHQRRVESKGRTTNPENLTPLLPRANRVSGSPNSPPTPLPRIWGGVSVTLVPLSPPLLPASTNQIGIGQVPAAHAAGGLLQLCPGRHPWVLKAHSWLQEGRSGSAKGPGAAQALPCLPTLRVIWRLSGASSLFLTLLPVVLLPLVPAAEDERHPWKWKRREC